MKSTLAWGILGTGSIARKFADELPFSRTGRLVAVGSRSSSSAEAFVAGLPGVTAHASYDGLLADERVEAVYVSTPHPFHEKNTLAALEAGKHVLCEKPMAMNAASVERMIAAARSRNRFLMEAFMYRCHPRMARICEIVTSGALGRIRLLQAAFSFAAPFNPASRLFHPGLGGGGILDVGCYTMSVTRLIAGVAQGLPFADPLEVLGTMVPAPSGVDSFAAATLKFPSEILAQIHCGVGLKCEADLTITGEEGSLHVSTFWNPPGPLEIQIGGERRTEPSRGIIYKYALEADAVADALPDLESPFMTWNDSLGNARALDQWLAGGKRAI